MTSAALRALLADLIDYAGLFPPAALSMADAVSNYAAYRSSPHAWALGRFIVPVARLGELADAAATYTRAGERPWRVSALMADDPAGDAVLIHAWNARQRDRIVVDVAEVRASSPTAIIAAAAAADPSLALHVEIPVADDPASLITVMARTRARAKIRSGGVDPGDFPTAFQIARFILRCAEADVPFKATAGLHHPLRAEHRLTYADDAPRGMMFGFLNVFLAAVLARTGAITSIGELSEVLEERDAHAITLSDDLIGWRTHRVPTGELTEIRARFAIAFGSCSFREPIEDLQRLHLLSS